MRTDGHAPHPAQPRSVEQPVAALAGVEPLDGQRPPLLVGVHGHGERELVQGRERETVMRRLHEIGAILDGYEPGTRLRDEPMAALLTAQEEVNGILAHGDKDRLVCTSSSPTGSHLKKSECLRYGELEANRRRVEKEMRDRQATPCNSRLCNDNR